MDGVLTNRYQQSGVVVTYNTKMEYSIEQMP